VNKLTDVEKYALLHALNESRGCHFDRDAEYCFAAIEPLIEKIIADRITAARANDWRAR
jgi:hypothetical protein